MKQIKLLFVVLILLLISLSISYGSNYPVTTDLNIRAVINTAEKGAIDAVWSMGGEETTAGGDIVIWGFFYASPSDVNWGSENNPDLYVKIWFDRSGRIDVNFFHVSVPDIDVYSQYSGSSNQYSRTTLDNRYYRHEYNDDLSSQTYYGTTFDKDSEETQDIVCSLFSDGSMTLYDGDGVDSGTYTINGRIFTGRLNFSDGNGVNIAGTASADGNTISGTWRHSSNGRSGTFTMSK